MVRFNTQHFVIVFNNFSVLFILNALCLKYHLYSDVNVTKTSSALQHLRQTRVLCVENVTFTSFKSQ